MPEPPERWTRVRITPDAHRPGARDVCVAALFSLGAQGVHEESTTLITHFPPATNLEAVHRVLSEADEYALIETEAAPEVDWGEVWKEHVRAHEVGGLTIAPPWLEQGPDPARTIVIEPGMAFGTGEHETTRGVVRLLSGVLRQGDVVADLGAGSAVLSIAAAKLGAARVYAIEIDDDAIPDAEANVERNGVAERVHVFHGDARLLLPLLAPVHVVLANIISSVLLELLPVIRKALSTDGRAILSGILLEERPDIVEALRAQGWIILEEDTEGLWWSVSIERA